MSDVCNCMHPAYKHTKFHCTILGCGCTRGRREIDPEPEFPGDREGTEAALRARIAELEAKLAKTLVSKNEICALILSNGYDHQWDASVLVRAIDAIGMPTPTAPQTETPELSEYARGQVEKERKS